MLEIKNVTQEYSVSVQVRYDQGGVPSQMVLRPGTSYRIMDEVFKQYTSGVKQDVAAMIAKAMIVANHSDEIHTYFDQDHIPSYAQDPAQPAGSEFQIARDNIIATTDGLHWDDAVTGLQTAIDAFINIRDNFSGHAESTAYHTVAGAASAATDPTDLPSLITQLGTLRTEYNAHILAVAQHPNADTINDVPIPALVTLEDCVLALRILNHNFGSHRMQYLLGGTVELTPIQIITDNYGNVTPVPPTPGSVTSGGGVPYQGSSETEAGDFKVDWASAISLDLSNLPFPVLFENFIGIYEYDDDNLISTYIPEDLTYDWTWVPGADTSIGTITLDTATFDAANKFVVLLRGPEKDFLDVMSDFGGNGVHQSYRDFAAVWASNTTLDISDMDFDPDADGTQIRAVVEIATGGRATVTYTRHDWAFSWTPGAAGAGVLAIAGAAMQATSKFIVFIEGPDRVGAAAFLALAQMNGDNIYKAPIHFNAVFQAAEYLDLSGHPSVTNATQFLGVKQKSSTGVETYHFPHSLLRPFTWDSVNDRLKVANASFTNTDDFYVVLEAANRYANDPSDILKVVEGLPYPLRADSAGVPLITSAENFTGSWVDLGPEIDCFGYNTLKLYLKLVINLTTGARVRVIDKQESGGAEEYNPQIETVGAASIAIQPQYWEWTNNADQSTTLVYKTDGTTPFVQVQIQAAVPSGTPGQITLAHAVRGWR